MAPSESVLTDFHYNVFGGPTCSSFIYFFLADVAFKQAGMRFLEFFHDVSLSVTSV